MTQSSNVSPELARQVGAVARALVAAVRSWSLYTPEHPSVARSLDRLHEAVQAATGATGLLVGVTPDALLVAEGVLSEDVPVREAAALLHDRDILSLGFAPEVPVDALRRLVAVLSLDQATRRQRGGPAAIWAVDGHPAIAIEQVDYARVLEDRPSAHPARRDALWHSIVRSLLERQKSFDEAAQQRLLEIAGDPAAIAELAEAITAPHHTPDGAPLLATKAATVLAAYRHLLSIVGVLAPERLGEVTRHLATATTALDPRVAVQMLASEPQAGAEASTAQPVQALARALDDEQVADLLARTLALEGRPTPRLATVFATLAPEASRKERILTLARTRLQASDFGGPASAFDTVWSAVEELLLRGNEQPFVSAAYRETLDSAQSRAATLAASELPPELGEWLASLGQENVRQLSVTLLIDLLRLERDGGRAVELVADLQHLAEDLLLAGEYASALQVARALAETYKEATAPGWEACGEALEALATSTAYREATGLLGASGEEELARFRALSETLGALTVDSLREVVMAEEQTLAGERAADLIVRFGRRAIPHLVPLVEHPEWTVRMKGAVLLGRIGTAAAVPLLQPLLRGADPRVLREAVRALTRIDDPAAGRAIHTALRAARGEARQSVIDALVAERDPRVAPILARMLDESQPFGADHALVLDTLEAVARAHAERAVPAVVRLLYRRSWWRRRRTRRVKQAAIGTLVALGTPQAHAALDAARQRGDRMVRRILAHTPTRGG